MLTTPDLIVLLPGITGSKLDKDGKTQWGLELGAGLRGIFTGGRATRDALYLHEDNQFDEFLDDGVQPVSLIKDYHGVPGFLKIDGYTKTRRVLQNKLDLKHGQLLEFPYDWRRDNRASARRLERVAGDALSAWRERSNNPDAKIVLVAHSMGGLVSRYYLEVLGGWRDARGLITFGTPFEGSVNSLSTLVNGVKKVVKLGAISHLMRSFTSMYQLLPDYRCFKIDADTRVALTDAGPIPHIDPEKVLAAAKFHSEIAEAEQRNLTEQAYLDHPYRVHPVIGTGQSTALTAILKNGRIETSTIMDGKKYGGDGTVPRFSAYPAASGEPEGSFYSNSEHGSLQSADAVLQQVFGVLTRGDSSSVELGGGSTPIDLSVEDIFLLDEDIIIRAEPLDDVEEINVWIENEVGELVQPEARMEINDDGLWEYSLEGLRPGTYRFKCYSNEVVETHGSFAVAGIMSTELEAEE